MRVGIIGASGYAGGELLRLLSRHPEAEVTLATSRQYSGEYLYLVHPNLRGVSNLKFAPFDPAEVPRKCDLVFTATPHGTSKDFVPGFLEHGLRVVDLSADFRLRNAQEYDAWYGWKHNHPELLKEAAFGIPELHREEIRKSSLVACAGCMATASILSLAPLVKSGLVDTDRMVVDAKIGSSGGGTDPTPASHHPERFGAVRPYEVVGHRHTAEIEQELSLLTGTQIRVAFTPHALDIARGILATSHLWVTKPLEDRDVWHAYRSFYREEPFVRFVSFKKGIYQLPDPKAVVGTNYCDIGFRLDTHVPRVVVFSALDNIVKGAAGQAVQCFNLMLGIDEKTGIDLVGIH